MEIREIAQKIHDRWNPVWLFVVSSQGFYFDSCSEILNKNGKIKELDWVDQEIQGQYLSLLKEFENL